MARDERAELVDLLVTLTPKQWDAPTLCSEWRVREWWPTWSATTSSAPSDLSAGSCGAA